ncbi:hypothetical protein T01_6982 [Trichinella spiralis]|uniref:Uncharacterized protein n=1 Tax=Trichinella spiralis TaxID=6334 RepID=A0A0V1BPG8_TRISP|nr:hypothetical protein T01_6982 [Trichinella spiralis]
MQWTMKAVPGTGWTSPVLIEDVCVRRRSTTSSGKQNFKAEDFSTRRNNVQSWLFHFTRLFEADICCQWPASFAIVQHTVHFPGLLFQLIQLGFELDHAGNHVDQGSKTVRLFRQIWHLLPKQLEHRRSGTGTFHRIFVDYSRRRGGKFKRRPVGAVARRQRRISDRILLGVGCMASWKLECTTARTIDRGSILYNNRRRRRSQLGAHWGRVIHCPRCPWLIWRIIRIGCVPSSMLASLFRTRCDRRIIITANCWRVLVSPTEYATKDVYVSVCMSKQQTNNMYQKRECVCAVEVLSNLSTKQLGGIATDYCQAENNVVYFIHATKQATTGDKLSCLNNFSSATPPDTEDTCKEHLGRHC